ncbi:MAG: c-type cytochrome [Planctomycetota bacterium]|jgi:mono/diheme cytochrome c family protein
MAKVDVEATDRRNKWWLLLVSLATLSVLIVAALEDSVYPEWRSTRLEHARILETKATDDRGRAIADQFDPGPDQHVLPELERVDRCVTCHAGIDDARLAGQPQPFCTHPGDLLDYHPLKKFGCTACHQGQGLATALPDAHGDVPFWPEPMIPARFAYAGCGACHVHVGVPDLARLWKGKSLLERYDCLACHRIDGRGGTIRPGGAGGMEGPDLSRVGVGGFDSRWYEAHLEQSREADEGPWKAAFGPIDETDRPPVEGYLWSRVGAPELIEAKALFHSAGCQGCHKVRGVGSDDGPDLTLVGEKDPHGMDFTHVPGARTLTNWLATHLRHPAKVVEGSLMPDLGLSYDQIDRLTLYMLSLRDGDVPQSFWPNDRVRAERLGTREFAPDGGTLFSAFCSGCHGPAGKGRRFPETVPFPSVASPDFLAVATDDFLKETILRGRPGRRMPAWDTSGGGLRREEIAAIVAHLRELAGVAEPEEEPAEPRWVRADADAGQRLYTARCSACHGADGKWLEAPELSNPVLLSTATDTYLVETISRGRRGTPMPGFRNPSPVHPVLSRTDVESIVAFIRTWEDTPQ